MNILQDPAPGNKRRWFMLALASIGALLSWFCRNSLTVIFPDISQSLDLNAQDLGLLSSLFFYFFAASQLPLGVILARFGVRPVMTGGMLLSCLGCVLFATASGAHMAFIGRALVGMGTSVSVMGGMLIVALWFSTARFAMLSGLILGIAGIGSLLASSPWVFLTNALGWRNGMMLVALVLFIIAVGCFVIIRNPERKPAFVKEGGFSLRQAAREILLSARFWIMGLTTCCRYGFLGTLQAVWAGPLLVYGMGFSQLSAANVLLLLAVGYMLGMPLLGILSDRWLASRKWVVCGGQFLLALLAASFLFWTKETPFVIVAGSFILLSLFAASGNAVFAHVKEINDPKLAPAALTWTNLFPMMGGAIFIQITSMLLPSDVSAITSPQDLSHLWWIGLFSALITALAYAVFIPESPAMLYLRQQHRKIRRK